jgi:hypothetical protein
MSAVRSMRKRVAALEQARAPRPFPYPLDDPAFTDGEGLDQHEWPLVLKSLQSWRQQGLFDVWRQGTNRVWHL